MVLAILIISLTVSIISMIVSNVSILISNISIIRSKVSIIIHGSAPLRKQEILGMPTMYLKPHGTGMLLFFLSTRERERERERERPPHPRKAS